MKRRRFRKELHEYTYEVNWNHSLPVYGERNQYPEQYRQAIVSFSAIGQEGPGFQVCIRVYNEGIAFRYEFENSGQTIIEAELTEFALPANADVWVSDRAGYD